MHRLIRGQSDHSNFRGGPCGHIACVERWTPAFARVTEDNEVSPYIFRHSRESGGPSLGLRVLSGELHSDGSAVP